MYTDVYKRVHTCTHLRSRYVPEERSIELAKPLTILVICASWGRVQPTKCEGLPSARPRPPSVTFIGDRGRYIAEYLVEREIKYTFALANSSKRVHVEAP